MESGADAIIAFTASPHAAGEQRAATGTQHSTGLVGVGDGDSQQPPSRASWAVTAGYQHSY